MKKAGRVVHLISLLMVAALLLTACAERTTAEPADIGVDEKQDGDKSVSATQARNILHEIGRWLPVKPLAEDAPALFTGNNLKQQPDVFFLGYIAGVKDAFFAVEQELSAVLEAYGDAFASKASLELYGDSDSRSWVVDEAIQMSQMDVFTKIGIARGQPKGEGVTLGQIQLVVNKYMDDHPGELNRSAAVLIWSALAELSGHETLGEHMEELLKTFEREFKESRSP